MKQVVGVKFKSSGKMYYFSPENLELKVGTKVIVDTASGDELAEVVMENKQIEDDKVAETLKKIIRIATTKDKKLYEEFKAKEKEAYQKCLEQIKEYELPMKLIEAEYKFDGTKLTFYFSSDKRIDFRELVKSLAAIFKTRIEMRQIGVRDEVKRLGGNGICGRQLCCCSFLRNFEAVSIKMAKDQNMSLNPSKISGNCGRLMCCLKYEHNVYCDKLKSLPKIGAEVKTQDGIGEVSSVETLKETVRVKFQENGENFYKKYNAKDIVVIRDSENETEKLETENEEDLKELQKMEKLDKEESKNKKQKRKQK